MELSPFAYNEIWKCATEKAAHMYPIISFSFNDTRLNLKKGIFDTFNYCSLGFPPNSFRATSISFTLIFFGEKWWIDSDFLRLVHLMWSHNVFIIIYKNYVLLRHRKYFLSPGKKLWNIIPWMRVIC